MGFSIFIITPFYCLFSNLSWDIQRLPWWQPSSTWIYVSAHYDTGRTWTRPSAFVWFTSMHYALCHRGKQSTKIKSGQQALQDISEHSILVRLFHSETLISDWQTSTQENRLRLINCYTRLFDVTWMEIGIWTVLSFSVWKKTKKKTTKKHTHTQKNHPQNHPIRTEGGVAIWSKSWQTMKSVMPLGPLWPLVNRDKNQATVFSPSVSLIISMINLKNQRVPFKLKLATCKVLLQYNELPK